MKFCKNCKIDKENDCFSTHVRTKDGLYSICKTCHRAKYPQSNRTNKKSYRMPVSYYVAYAKKYIKTAKGCRHKMYWGMKYRVNSHKNYAGMSVDFTLKEFYAFLDKTNFEKLHIAWIESGYMRKLAPSVDRLDNTKGYSLDNIQIITLSENCSKPRRKRSVK